METILPSTFQAIFSSFSCAFTAPSLVNFSTLATGWMLCWGRHTISRVIQASGKSGRAKHHSAFYRFFSRAVWVPDRVGKTLFHLLIPFTAGNRLYALVDDTLCRKSGPHVWGAAMHHDPLASTYGWRSARGRHVAFAYGHNWVVLALWVVLPWNADKGVAIPILLRLYRSKKRCPAGQYRKRTEIALELVQTVASWTPPGKTLCVVGDAEYACKTIVKQLPPWVHFTGPVGMKAALYRLPPERRRRRRGAPRKKGARLPAPADIAESESIRWKRTTLSIYGRQVTARVKTMICLWYTVAGPRPVRLVITRDPKGRIEDRAYFSTLADACPEEIMTIFSRRWSLEVTFFNTKQFLGLQDPQNGWGRRKAGCRFRKKRPGPQPRGRRGDRAAARTVPVAFFTYGVIHLWYFQHGKVACDVRSARNRAPWYRHKTEPSFADMLRAARKELLLARFSAYPQLSKLHRKIEDALPEWLLAA